MSTTTCLAPCAAVIDDDGLVRGLVKTILGGRGWRTRAFADARSALAALADDPVDVVVCDLNLPDVGGDRLVEALRASLGRAAPPVVMISGADDEVRVGRALDAGAWHYVKKPFAPGELLAIVERAARRRGAGAREDLGRPERLGRFSVTSELGRGGMGVVYEGVDDEGRRAALKVLPAGRATTEDHLRFRRELDVLADLDHPGVARLLEAGLDDGRAWFAMERVPGRSLEALLRRRGALPWVEAARLARDLAAALAYVHGRGLVHRDVKPSNVIVRPDGSPVLVDFGLARRPRDLALTSPSVLIGTPLYMAPELGGGAAPSPASDVFGLGLVLHEALAGRPPLDPARYLVEPLAALITYARGDLPAPVAPPDRPPIPAGLRRIVAAMTRPDPAPRPTAADVVHALTRGLRDAPPPPLQEDAA